MENLSIIKNEDFPEFQENDSLLTSTIIVGEEEREPKYFIHVVLPHKNDQIIKKVKDDFNPIELPYLSTQVNPLTLYQLNDPPLELE